MKAHRTGERISRRAFVQRTGLMTLGALAVGLTPHAAQAALTAAPVAQSGPRRGGTLTIALSQEPTGGFDPHLSSHLLAQHHFELAYEQLLVTQPDGSIGPGLAESWEQVDPTTLEFKLRKGVKWHHGPELTAEDVKFSFERQADPQVAGMNQAIYGPVLDRVEVVDPLTVRIVTKMPFAPLVSFLAAPREGNIVPADFTREKGDLKATMSGTGPFKFVEYTPGSEARFVRNPDYWQQGKPYVDEIVLKYITDDQARLAALRSGAVDLAFFSTPSVVQPLQNDPAFTWANTKALVTRHLVLNNAREPLTDVRIRRAISLALNRQEMIDVNLLGFGAISAHIPPADEFWAYPDPASLPYYTPNLEQAKQLMAEANASGIKLPLKTGPNPLYVADGELVQGYLQPIGIEVELVKQEQAAWIDDFWKVNHDSLLMGYQSFVDPDAYFYRQMHSQSPASWTNIKNPELDALLDKGRVTMDRPERQKIYHDVQRLLADQAHEIILYAQVWGFEAMLPYVKGYFPMTKTLSRTLQLREVWLDK